MRTYILSLTYIHVDYRHSSNRNTTYQIPYWTPPTFPDVFAVLTAERRQEEEEALEVLRMIGSTLARAALDVAEVIAQAWTQIKAGFARLAEGLGEVWNLLASLFSPPVPVTS